MLQKCRMLWYNTKNRDLGISDENDYAWNQAIINWSEIIMICAAEEEEDSPEFGMTKIFLRSGEYFVVDIPYTEAEKQFTTRGMLIT